LPSIPLECEIWNNDGKEDSRPELLLQPEKSKRREFSAENFVSPATNPTIKPAQDYFRGNRPRFAENKHPKVLQMFKVLKKK
jgi:hypothetical protein